MNETPKVKEVIERLQGYDPEEHIAALIWSEDDVIEQAKMRGLREITKEQAQKIIDTIDRKKSATLGINWDTIDLYTDECLSRQSCPPNCSC